MTIVPKMNKSYISSCLAQDSPEVVNGAGKNIIPEAERNLCGRSSWTSSGTRS